MPPKESEQRVENTWPEVENCERLNLGSGTAERTEQPAFQCGIKVSLMPQFRTNAGLASHRCVNNYWVLDLDDSQ